MNSTEILAELNAKLVIAEYTEQNLKSAENALIEKDDYIQKLKNTIKHNKQLHAAQDYKNQQANQSLTKAYNKVVKIAHYYKETTRDLVSVNQSLTDRIVSLVETQNDANPLLKLKNAMLEHESQELKDSIATLKQENQELKEAVAILTHRLKDIKGTINSMCD